MIATCMGQLNLQTVGSGGFVDILMHVTIVVLYTRDLASVGALLALLSKLLPNLETSFI